MCTARALAVVLVAGALSSTSTAAMQRRVHGDMLVAAAASLSGLAPQLSRAFHDTHGLDVRFNFGGSNTLARQIIEGARVDVFISADVLQMELVEQAGRVVAGSRVDIVSNQLVVIVPATGTSVIRAPDDLVSAQVRRVAMGDPAAVPAGVYGRRWLETVRLWSAVEPKVVPLPSSPAALAAVREGRADAAVVYATDAKGQEGVRVAHVVAPENAPPIVYPAAAITGGRHPYARTFLTFLRSDEARRIFENAGFRLLANR